MEKPDFFYSVLSRRTTEHISYVLISWAARFSLYKAKRTLLLSSIFGWVLIGRASHAGFIGMLKDSWLHGEFWTVIRDTRSVPIVSACPKITVLDKAFPHAIHCNPGWAAKNCRGGICQHCIWRVAGSRESHIPSISGSTGTCRSGESKNIWVSCIVTIRILATGIVVTSYSEPLQWKDRLPVSVVWTLSNKSTRGCPYMQSIIFSSRLCFTVKLSACFYCFSSLSRNKQLSLNETHDNR